LEINAVFQYFSAPIYIVQNVDQAMHQSSIVHDVQVDFSHQFIKVSAAKQHVFLQVFIQHHVWMFVHKGLDLLFYNASRELIFCHLHLQLHHSGHRYMLRFGLKKQIGVWIVWNKNCYRASFCPKR
jgi:hypothetical protein